MCSFPDLVSCQENYPTKHSREVQDKLKAKSPNNNLENSTYAYILQ